MPLKILQHLVERPAEVVTRGELQSPLWNGTAFGDFEQGLNTATNIVRKTLGHSADEARYIETVAGQGYRFVGTIRSEVAAQETRTSSSVLGPEWMAADANQPAKSALEIRKPPPRRKVTAARLLWVIAALVIAALGGGTWWIFQSKPQALIYAKA